VLIHCYMRNRVHSPNIKIEATFGYVPQSLKTFRFCGLHAALLRLNGVRFVGKVIMNGEQVRIWDRPNVGRNGHGEKWKLSNITAAI
jgi:hypothetical protein